MELLGGPLFAVAAAGESHGPAVTTIVFGCPPGLHVERSDIQRYLDRRRPGSNRHGTPRQEKDKVVLLSGLYQTDHDSLTGGPLLRVEVDDRGFESGSYESGYTTGEPLAAIVLSTSGRSRHYDQFSGPQGAVRPGHTDLVKYYKSGGFVDPRGGGRSSYRSTISDVIGGSIARRFLQTHFGTRFISSISQVGPLQAQTSLAAQLAALGEQPAAPAIDDLIARIDAAEIPSIDAEFAAASGELIKQTRIAGDSLGAQLEVVAVNVPPLLGDPLYNSLKLQLMGLLGGLHAAQACEIGDGIAVISRRGSQNNDPIRSSGYQANSHGGLLGGVTTGMPLVARVGFKPTSTILHKQQSVQKDLQEIDFELDKGRHDPCVGVRAGVTLESRMAIAVMNAVLMQQAQQVDPGQFALF